MAEPDKLLDLAIKYVDARRHFVTLAETYPKWSEKIQDSYHELTKRWLEEHDQTCNALHDIEKVARRALLLEMLVREFELDVDQHDVSASDCLRTMTTLLQDVLKRA